MSMKPRLIIVCGLPGSGKTTHARKLERSLPGIRFNADEWMEAVGIDLWNETARTKIEALQWQLAQQLLRSGQVVLIEWGTWSRSERDALREGARSLDAAVELHYLSAPVDLLFHRIRRRATENPPVPKDQIEKWAALFQAPTPEELALYDAACTIPA